MMPADGAAIRAAYRLKDRCYMRRDLARLAPTDLPTFTVVDANGASLSHAAVWRSMRWRMAHQVACHREERPIRIDVHGARARVEVATFDDWTVRTDRGTLRRRTLRFTGVSDWTRTSAGWKQASLRLRPYRWRDAQGTWRS